MRKIFFFLLIFLFVSLIVIMEIDKPKLTFALFNQSFNRAVPRMILYTRIVNLVLSVCMIIASLLSLLTTANATTGVLACYVMVFSCLLCCFETHLKQISKIIALNFGFLYSAKSRAVFMIFVGTILFSFSLFGKIVGCAMLVNACFNIFILFKYPQYEDAQRNDAQSEIKDYLASNPAFANHMVKGATEFVASNPEILKKGVENWASVNSGYSNV